MQASAPSPQAAHGIGPINSSNLRRAGQLTAIYSILVALFVVLICAGTFEEIQPLALRNLQAAYAANTTTNLTWMMLLGSTFTLLVGAAIVASMFRYPVPIMVVLYSGLCTGVICSFFLWYYGAITDAVALQLIITLDFLMLSVIVCSLCLFLILARRLSYKITFSAVAMLLLALVFWLLPKSTIVAFPHYTLLTSGIVSGFLLFALYTYDTKNSDPQQNVAIALGCCKLVFCIGMHIMLRSNDNIYAALPTYATLYWVDLMFFTSLCWFAVSYYTNSKQQQTIHAARLAQRVAELSPLIGNSRHELRSPLTDIVGLAALVGDGPLDQQQRKAMLEIQRTAHAGLNHINRLFSFNPAVSQQKADLHVPFSLEKVVNDCVSYYSYFMDENDREIIINVSSADHHLLLGDPEKIRQMFIHLFEYLLTDQEANEILVDIANTGNTKQYIVTLDFNSHIENWNELSPGSATLTSASQISAQLNCQLQFFNEQKKICVTLNLEKQSGGSQQPSDTSELAGKRVLVLDDNATSCNVITSYLNRWKINSSAETLPLKASARMHHQQEIEEPIDLVIVDFQMPGINGADFIIQTLQDNKITEKPDFIVMSNTYPEEKRSLLKNLGVHYILEKPVMPETLRLALTQQMDLPRKKWVPPKGLNVLLIEDNPVSAGLTTALLNAEAMHVSAASSGRQALELLDQTAFDWIIVDCNLPDLSLATLVDGLQKKMAGHNSKSPTLLVALSADDSESLRAECKQLGIPEFFSKPLSREKIGRAIDSFQRLQDAH